MLAALLYCYNCYGCYCCALGWVGIWLVCYLTNLSCRQLYSKLEHIISVNPQEDNCHFINLTRNKDLCMYSTNISKAFSLCQALL